MDDFIADCTFFWAFCFGWVQKSFPVDASVDFNWLPNVLPFRLFANLCAWTIFNFVSGYFRHKNNLLVSFCKISILKLCSVIFCWRKFRFLFFSKCWAFHEFTERFWVANGFTERIEFGLELVIRGNCLNCQYAILCEIQDFYSTCQMKKVQEKKNIEIPKEDVRVVCREKNDCNWKLTSKCSVLCIYLHRRISLTQK